MVRRVTLQDRIVEVLKTYGFVHVRQLCAILNGKRYVDCLRTRCRYFHPKDGKIKPDCSVKPSLILYALKRLEEKGIVVKRKVKMYDPITGHDDVYTFYMLKRID